jgi:hypothetical protein
MRKRVERAARLAFAFAAMNYAAMIGLFLALRGRTAWR